MAESTKPPFQAPQQKSPVGLRVLNWVVLISGLIALVSLIVSAGADPGMIVYDLVFLWVFCTTGLAALLLRGRKALPGLPQQPSPTPQHNSSSPLKVSGLILLISGVVAGAGLLAFFVGGSSAGDFPTPSSNMSWYFVIFGVTALVGAGIIFCITLLVFLFVLITRAITSKQREH